MVSNPCEFSYVLSAAVIERTSSYKRHIHMASLRYEYSYVPSGYVIGGTFIYEYYIHMASPRCVFLCSLM
jgi:hypothetical protein